MIAILRRKNLIFNFQVTIVRIPTNVHKRSPVCEHIFDFESDLFNELVHIWTNRSQGREPIS